MGDRTSQQDQVPLRSGRLCFGWYGQGPGTAVGHTRSELPALSQPLISSKQDPLMGRALGSQTHTSLVPFSASRGMIDLAEVPSSHHLGDEGQMAAQVSEN